MPAATEGGVQGGRKQAESSALTRRPQGDVYAKIIEDVCAASATDFEESGVGSSTLLELQQVRIGEASFFVQFPSFFHHVSIPHGISHEHAKVRGISRKNGGVRRF